MKTWHIWDFPDTVYISLTDNIKEDFFRQIFNKFGGKKPYARFLGISQMSVKQYHRGYTYKEGVKHPQAIPLSLFKKSLPLMNAKLKEKIEKNICLIKAKNKGTPVINPKLPFNESPQFYRIVAHMIGDGSAPGRKVPYYANTCNELREQFKRDLNIFGEVKSYERKLKDIPIVCFPKVITDILSHILDVKFSNPDRIPQQIFNTSDESKSAFLIALFDDEGTVSTNLAISMSNLNIINEIKKLIESLGVKTGNISIKRNKIWKDNFSFNVSRENLQEFKEKIGFSHPEKIKNLEAEINTKNRKQRARDAEEVEKHMIKILVEKPLKTIEIANSIQLTLGHTLRYLKKLEKDSKVIRRGFKNKIIWSLP